jgi:SOS-response transcriptional repressor LexA
MSPEIEDGDQVICDPTAEILNGDIVHYRIGGESAIKVYVKDEEAFIVQFIPYNTTDNFKTKTIRLDDDLVEQLYIAKVVAINKVKFNNRNARLRLIGRS